MISCTVSQIVAPGAEEKLIYSCPVEFKFDPNADHSCIH